MSTLKWLLYVVIIVTLINKCNCSACLPSDGIANGNIDTNSYNEFTFITRKEWKANSWRNDICSCNASDTTEMKPLSEPYIITIHHTAEPTQSISRNDSIQKIQDIQNYHQYTHNWCDIGYNFIIDSAGNIFQGRPFWDDNETFVIPLNTTRKWPIPRLIEGSHSLNSNRNNIGIAVLGCYDSNCPNTSDMIKRYDITYTRLIQLISWLCDYYNINPSDSTIVRHSYWKNTTCPGNILGATQMFNDIISDVQMTIDQGTGLCYDYLTNIHINASGGICSNSQQCHHNLIIDTGDDDQCSDLGQVCCKVISNNDNGDGDGDKVKKDWGSIYIVIGIIVFVIIILIIGFALKKRKEYLIAHSNYADLAENIPVQQETE